MAKFEIPEGLGTFQQLQKRFNNAEGLYQLWRSLHQEAFDFANPDRENFRFRSPGQRKNRNVFDATATQGLQQFSSRLQGSLVPSWQQWIRFVAGEEIPEDDKVRVGELLEQVTDVFFTNLNMSNFDTEINPTFADIGIGTGAIMVGENTFTDDTVLNFTNVPLSEFYPERNPGGTIINSWRKQRVVPAQIQATWPEADIPPALGRLIKDNNQSEVDIITGHLFNKVDRRYYMIVTYPTEQAVLFVQSFETKRMIASRWHVSPGETYGRGPIILNLPDIRTINKVKQFILENAAIQIAGIYTGVSDGVFNPHTVRIQPGVIIPVTSNQTTNPSLSTLPRTGDFNVAGIVLADLQASIKKALMVDPMGDISDPFKTATENILRNQENLRLMGASIGRLMTELLVPIVEACMNILQERGILPPMRVDGREVTIRQQSPLAKSQDLEDFENSLVWLDSLQKLPQEVVAGTVKIEDLPEYWAENLGVPASLVRDQTQRQAFANTLIEGATAQAGAQPGQVQQTTPPTPAAG